MLVTTMRHVRRASVAHIPVFSGRAFVWADVASRLIAAAGTPLVLSLHGGNLPILARRRPDAVRRLLDRAAIVVAPSEYLRQELASLRKDIRLMPNPVELRHYPFVESNVERKRLIWLRAFQTIYNPTLAPRMLAILCERHPDVHLTMVGATLDETRIATERVAEDLGVRDRITFLGAVPKTQVARHLRDADVFINTTNVDNMPVSVIEAMALGLPIVSTNVGGIPHLLSDGTDALLVPPDDPRAFADAVSRLFTAPAMAATLARAARAKVEPFDWRIMLERWEALLREAASRKK